MKRNPACLFYCFSLLLGFSSLIRIPAFAQSKQIELTPFERDTNQTATYEQIIRWYRQLDRQYDQAKLIEIGKTDVGKPLHLFLLAADRQFTARPDRVTLLINNGIHPGEPEGIDACMMMARDLLKANTLPKNVLVAIVPVFNVGGSLNRGVSRVNQNGPDSYGFRGNARNLNLNRDFIKAEAQNTQAFQAMYQSLKPQVFIDNHTSDGADYQHVLTYFATQKDKLHPAVSEFMTQTFQPELDKMLLAKGFPAAPYVNHAGDTPESGLVGYYDSPRYTTGYAAMFNCIGFTLETHMWKPYPPRVRASYVFDEAVMRFCEREAKTLLANQQRANDAVRQQKTFSINYKLDRSKVDSVTFLGYAAAYKASDVSGLKRLYYDRSKPFKKRVPYFNTFVADAQVDKPRYYVVPQAWPEVARQLTRNGVTVQSLPRDSSITVSVYYVTDYKSPQRPYEGHYIHTGVKTRTESQRIQFYKGDFLISTDQVSNRYIIETLEPQCVDSFFAWNFFDSILDQKEYFAGYIFEDTAAELVKNDPALRKQLDEKRAADKAFAESANAQLDFIYKQTPYYEKTHNRYPVYRLN